MTTKEMSSKSVCPTRSKGLHVFATLYLDYGLVFGGATLECRPTSSSFVISTSCHPHRRNFEFRCLARGCSSRHHHSLEPFVVLHATAAPVTCTPPKEWPKIAARLK